MPRTTSTDIFIVCLLIALISVSIYWRYTTPKVKEEPTITYVDTVYQYEGKLLFAFTLPDLSVLSHLQTSDSVYNVRVPYTLVRDNVNTESTFCLIKTFNSNLYDYKLISCN